MKIYFHLSLEGFSNTYVVTNSITNEALIIDPGIITREILEQLESGPFNLAGILVTHNHPSHVRGISTLSKIYTPQIYAADYEVAGTNTVVLKGDGIIKIAGLTVAYLAVPGHTPDSMAYKIGRVMFTGDALTACMTGETSNSYAEKTLLTNIQNKIFHQQDDVVVMPGHGPPSSIGAEKKYNLSLGCPVLSVVDTRAPSC